MHYLFSMVPKGFNCQYKMQSRASKQTNHMGPVFLALKKKKKALLLLFCRNYSMLLELPDSNKFAIVQRGAYKSMY